MPVINNIMHSVLLLLFQFLSVYSVITFLCSRDKLTVTDAMPPTIGQNFVGRFLGKSDAHEFRGQSFLFYSTK